MNIYTPNAANPFTGFRPGDRVKVTILGSDEFTGNVQGFPKNNANDTEHRMTVLPGKKDDWVGSIVISSESNFYGQWHWSQVSVEKV